MKASELQSSLAKLCLPFKEHIIPRAYFYEGRISLQCYYGGSGCYAASDFRDADSITVDEADSIFARMRDSLVIQFRDKGIELEPL